VNGVEGATTTPASATVATELAAMKRLVTTLEALDQGTRARVLTWLFDRYDAVTGESE
jgi:hypothetical protein